MPDMQDSGQVSAPQDQGGEVTDQTQSLDNTQGPTGQPDNTAIAKYLKTRVASSKMLRRQYHGEWKTNIELRMGRTGSVYYTGGQALDDSVQTPLNPDWSLTKAKTANLFSQVPRVLGTHESTQYAAAVGPFIKQLNYEIGDKRANLGVMMEEVLNDVVNASGVGFVKIGYTARFDTVQVPGIDTAHIPQAQLPQLQQAGQIPMRSQQRTVSDMFFGTRISPSDGIWPAEFAGSNFDNADFVGFTGRKSWPEAQVDFGLTEEERNKVVGDGEKLEVIDNLRSEPERSARDRAQLVTYDELYYWRYRFDATCKQFKEIWKIVYVHGLDEAVSIKVHEQWKGQTYAPDGKTLIGATKFPVRILTLTYISDNPIPPSDSKAGRPQVIDMQRSRSQMFKNRERSVPIRWFDVNRVDPEIQANLMRGTWQGMIPTNGDGSRSIGEIARASYPAEDFSFDQAAKQDLMETWQLGANQLGVSPQGRQTAAESQINQQNFSTRMGQERTKCAKFFLECCEVLSGLLVLYSDFPVLTPQEQQTMMQAWNDKVVTHDLVLKVLPDSTVQLDPSQELQKLSSFLNLTAKSGYVNAQPLIVRMAELSGIDPSEVIVQPQPPPPDKPKITLTLQGKEDLMNPMVVAMLQQFGDMPSAQAIEAAKQLLTAAQMPPAPPAQPGLPGVSGAVPAGPGGLPPAGGPPSAGPGVPAGPVPPAAQFHPSQDAHPDWQLAHTIAKRERDI